MEYFGTNLMEAGHYRWNMDGFSMERKGLRFNDLPFNPEELTNGLFKGMSAFYQGGGYTVLAIAGSPIDERQGTKSVFWVEEIVPRDIMIEKVKSNTLAMKIIDAMPFKVIW